VTYQNGFTIVPVGSPEVSLQVTTRTLEGGDLTAFASAVVQVDAANTGLQDASDLTLVVERQRSSDLQEMMRQPFKINAASPAQVTFAWPPAEPGSWQLRARLERPNGQTVATSGQVLDVRPSLRQQSLEAGAFFNAEGLPPLAALPLVVVALMVGWVARTALVADESGGRRW
jgi:hypothetical protein